MMLFRNREAFFVQWGFVSICLNDGLKWLLADSSRIYGSLWADIYGDFLNILKLEIFFIFN